MLGFGHGARGSVELGETDGPDARERSRGARLGPGCALLGSPVPSSMSQLITIFVTVFLAELGDKTQLATLLFAADRGGQHPLAVFFAAAAALVTATAVAVVLGSVAEHYLAAVPLKLLAGLGFVAIGLWTIWSHFTVG